MREALLAAHNVLKAHGQAVKMLRTHGKQPLQIGFAPAGKFTYPKSESPEDVAAAKKMLMEVLPREEWWWSMTWWNDPVFFGKYPEQIMEKYRDILPQISREDMALISQPLDFVGHNIYDGRMVEADARGIPVFTKEPPGFPHTHIKSPVTPEILYWMPKFLYERYGKPVLITENGMSNGDLVSADGKVHDGCRIAYLESYLGNLRKAAAEVPVMGYFHWSLTDNFEWAYGYQERFGLIHVDYRTQKRTVKDSGHWYKKVIETNGEIIPG